MAQSLSRILIHTIFSTKDRRGALTDRELRAELHAYLGGILANLDCQPLIVGGVADHVHLLSTLARTQTVANVVKETKRAATLWLQRADPVFANFAWQNGYGAFSIGASQVAAVRKYIARQEEHHRQVSFQDEFRTLLTRYDVEFDERYVWD
ncbi:IS200/IS605 family transposase [Lacipirellula sp.]|uniref:IS200/IS605 family transposase n=1 Tax=Lacipirellula sp. TaxID=2691419 RepID=UPI003D09C7BD